MSNQKCRTKTIFGGCFLPKVDVKRFPLSIHPVMQQHMVHREGKKSTFASFLSAALLCFADPCCAATFSDGLLRTVSFWKHWL